MQTFAELEKACAHFEGFSHPWFVAGGWAIDLACGRITRSHQDVDFCVFRDSLPSLFTHFSEWEKIVCGPNIGQRKQCHSTEDVKPPLHELLFKNGKDTVEILLIDRQDKHVLFRRDPTIFLPFDEFACQHEKGIPFVHPAWQLLFKAKEPREKDNKDFHSALPCLDPKSRNWLLRALRLHYPEISWIHILKTGKSNQIGINDGGIKNQTKRAKY